MQAAAETTPTMVQSGRRAESAFQQVRGADTGRTNQQNALAGDLSFHRRLEMNGEIANLIVRNRRSPQPLNT
jgi:hypothetical protein